MCPQWEGTWAREEATPADLVRTVEVTEGAAWEVGAEAQAEEPAAGVTAAVESLETEAAEA